SARQYQNISKATLEGATLTWSTTLSDWRTSATLDTLDAKNATTHQPLERRAKEKLSVSANRDWGLWNTGIELISVGRRYSTTTNNVAVLPMGGYTLINLSARYTLAQEWALELSANNITDKQYTTARANSLYDYNTPGANYFVGLRYQMK
ncbi:MAG TPA: TonB-dependent receptor, partial [Rhodocyclaceae bacterium]|nr:TonB-dependent receptor [Rhodocyclaceae bacterium]